jgi:hypothetical protein
MLGKLLRSGGVAPSDALQMDGLKGSIQHGLMGLLTSLNLATVLMT